VLSALLAVSIVAWDTRQSADLAQASPSQGVDASHCNDWHAQWVQQSASYIKLNPGTQQEAWVWFRNVGTCTWERTLALLGTREPEPGQDQPSPVGGCPRLCSCHQLVLL
jgi:hypothetical protein